MLTLFTTPVIYLALDRAFSPEARSLPYPLPSPTLRVS